MDPMGLEDIPDFLNKAGVFIWDGCMMYLEDHPMIVGG